MHSPNSRKNMQLKQFGISQMAKNKSLEEENERLRSGIKYLWSEKDELNERIAHLESHRDALHETANRYLERARKAEAAQGLTITAYRGAIDALCGLLNLVRHHAADWVVPVCLERTDAEYAVKRYNDLHPPRS